MYVFIRRPCERLLRGHSHQSFLHGERTPVFSRDGTTAKSCEPPKSPAIHPACCKHSCRTPARLYSTTTPERTKYPKRTATFKVFSPSKTLFSACMQRAFSCVFLFVLSPFYTTWRPLSAGGLEHAFTPSATRYTTQRGGGCVVAQGQGGVPI